MLGGETVKELYEKGKGRSVRGFASTCGRRRCRSPRPNRKRGAKLDAYTEYIDVRVSEVLENCVALIVDEFGIWPYDRESATAFFSLVSARYERGSIILTSNKGFADWREPLGDTVIATAILNRLPHHSHVLNICRESYRLKDKHQAGLLTSHRLLTSTARVGQIQLGENARRPTAH